MKSDILNDNVGIVNIINLKECLTLGNRRKNCRLSPTNVRLLQDEFRELMTIIGRTTLEDFSRKLDRVHGEGHVRIAQDCSDRFVKYLITVIDWTIITMEIDIVKIKN